MRENFERSLALVLGHEGGFADHPADPGGATNKGITRATYEDWLGRPVSVAELKVIPDATVAAIYRARYWDAVAADALPAGVDSAVFDFAVNSGPGRAARTLQLVVGVEQDGRIGPRTLAAVAAMPAGDLIKALGARRLAFLKRLATWPTFGRGWSSRVADVEREALAMTASPSRQPDDPGPPPSIPASEGRGLFARLLTLIATLFAK